MHDRQRLRFPWSRALAGATCALAAATASPLPLDALAAVAEPAAVLARAHRALDEQKPARAAEILLELAGSELGDHAQLLRAGILRGAGDLDGAGAAAAGALALDPPSEVRARAHAELARVELARGELLSAYRSFRAASDTARAGESAASYLQELARAFEQRGMPGDALLVYREVARRWPTADAGLDAFERGERLRRATGAASDPPLDLVQRGELLRDGYRCEPGLAAFELALAADALEDELRARAERGRADCLFQRRRYAEAETAYAALARRRPAELSPAIEHARARGRLGETLAAADELRALARRARGAERARIEYLEAVMVRELDPARYRKAMTRVAAQSDSPGDAESARWNLAWDEVQAGRWAEAEQRLEPMARGDAANVEVQRARYWLARVREQRAPEQGRADLDALAADVPLSYYGLSAARRLGVAPALERPVLGARASAGGDRAIRRARWLVEGGFPDPAQDEIESRVRQGGLGREERVEAADLLHAAGNPFRAVSVVLDGFGASLEQGVDPAWRDVWRLAWPRPFTGTVQSATAEFGFEPELVWAVMREESTYRPAIESPVGARGLMQIMPPTGERIANALGVAGFEAGSLYEPAVNVRFGTYYLNDLLALFGGSKPLAIAAYNAGPEAVSRWIATEPPVEEDRFVESVPYGETRRYVRKVLRSYQVYGLLYGATPAPAAPPDAQPGAGSGR